MPRPRSQLLDVNCLLAEPPQLIGKPSISVMSVATTLAEAPIGVALPPILIPSEIVQANVDRLRAGVSAMWLIPGTMMAARGMLSTMKEVRDIEDTIIPL